MLQKIVQLSLIVWYYTTFAVINEKVYSDNKKIINPTRKQLDKATKLKNKGSQQFIGRSVRYIYSSKWQRDVIYLNKVVLLSQKITQICLKEEDLAVLCDEAYINAKFQIYVYKAPPLLFFVVFLNVGRYVTFAILNYLWSRNLIKKCNEIIQTSKFTITKRIKGVTGQRLFVHNTKRLPMRYVQLEADLY